MYCKGCGNEIEGDSVFCRYCGAQQTTDSVPEAPLIGEPERPRPETEKGPQPNWLAWAAGGFTVLLVVAALLGPRTPSEERRLAEPLPVIEGAATVPTDNVSALQEPVAVPPVVPEPNWTYTTDEDKVRGATTYYARTTSTNTIRQDSPYDSETTMSILVRKSPAHGTDVLFTISSGQMMCPSYEGCRGTVSFDGGLAQSISFNGPSDNSSETIFVNGARDFIAKLKKAKKLVVEKTLYQAGNPQFEFDVSGLKWEH